MSCSLRKFQDGDEQAIVELLDAAFGKWHSLEYYKWWYTKNPAGPSIIWLAEYDNKIIGHYGIVPMAMKVGNVYATGSFSCDAATHPKYQSQGVFSSIVNRAYLDAGENHIPVTYGFANTNLGATYKRYERIGRICFMIRMTKALDRDPLLARYVGRKVLTGTATRQLPRTRASRYPTGRFRIETSSRFDERVNTFWEEISRNFAIIVRRDERHLNWRYADHPERKYTIYTVVRDHRILGYCVMTQQKWGNLRLGLIADILGFQDQGNVVGYLIDEAVEHFKKENVQGVSCMMSEQHPYGPLFRRAGFITHPKPNRALKASINLPGSRIDEKEIYSQALLLSQNSFLKTKSNWFVNYGDGDTA